MTDDNKTNTDSPEEEKCYDKDGKHYIDFHPNGKEEEKWYDENEKLKRHHIKHSDGTVEKWYYENDKLEGHYIKHSNGKEEEKWFDKHDKLQSLYIRDPNDTVEETSFCHDKNGADCRNSNGSHVPANLIGDTDYNNIGN